MMRHVISATTAAIVSLLALALVASMASAQLPTPTCVSGQGIVATSTPGYGTQGAPFSVGIQTRDASRVSAVDVTLSQGATVLSNTAVTLSSAVSTATLTAPSSGSTLTVSVAWDQDAGSPAACSGTDVLTVPLIAPNVTAGDPARPRLSGAFAVIERPFDYHAADSRPTWTFVPACAYFACGASLTSSQGLALPLTLGKTGLYHGYRDYDARVTHVSCTVPHVHLFVIKNAYTLREDVFVRVRRSADGVVTRISGSIIASYTPTRAARRQGCTFTERAIEQFDGHR